MTRKAGKAVWLAAALILVLAAGLALRPNAARTDIPVLSRVRLMALDGFVPVSSLLPGTKYQFVCLLGPYDETALQFASDPMPTGLQLDLLEPAFSIDEDEFYIVGLTATGADFNRYDRQGLNVLSGIAELPLTAHHVHDNRALCGRTEDVSFYLLPGENRRATGIGLIETRVPAS